MDIGIIGFGNMGGAIAEGLQSARPASLGTLRASARDRERLTKRCEALHILPCANREAAEKSDLVILAVKPYQVEKVVGEIFDALHGKMVVSVASGISFDALKALLPADAHALCAIPNTPVAVCRGIFCCEQEHSFSENELRAFESVFSSVGLIMYLDPKQLPAASAVAGCGPAFAALFIEALGDAAVKNGVQRQSAYRIAAQMLEGAAALCLNAQKHPAQMKDEVCSPGGTTIRGIAALEENGFRHSLISAVDATLRP